MADERRGAWKWMAAALVLLVALGGVVAIAFSDYNPYFMYMPAWREADGIFQAARKRPLTDAEFDRAAELARTADKGIRIRMFGVLSLEAERAPERRPAVRAAFAAAAADANLDPRFRRVAVIDLTRVPADDAPGRDPFAPEGAATPATR